MKNLILLLFTLSAFSCANPPETNPVNSSSDLKINGYSYTKYYTIIDKCEYLILSGPSRMSLTKIDCDCKPSK